MIKSLVNLTYTPETEGGTEENCKKLSFLDSMTILRARKKLTRLRQANTCAISHTEKSLVALLHVQHNFPSSTPVEQKSRSEFRKKRSNENSTTTHNPLKKSIPRYLATLDVWSTNPPFHSAGMLRGKI